MPATSPLLSVLTLIVKPDATRLERAEATARAALAASGCAVLDRDCLSEGEAVDLIFLHTGPSALRQAMTVALDGHEVDFALQPVEGRRKRALLADMDSTMITVECIDELADYAGIRDEVARVTEAAMRGELDFAAALKARVRLLAGLDVAMLERCYDERVRFTPGARTLVATMAQHGARTMLVSGGFTFFTERVAATLGFDETRANRLGISKGRLTGEVEPPLVTAETKREALAGLAGLYGIASGEVLAVGDGANDIPMLEAAGLGVAYHARPKAEAAADVAIRHCDLSALLFIQGYRRKDFHVPATD